MKKQILSFAIVATMIGSMAAGCSSTKKAEGSDSTSTTSTMKDSSSTMSTDTTKRDTTKTPPKM